MPQLDFFTLLFQFKSFFVFFSLMYIFFLFYLVPRLHLIISVRRWQVLKLFAYSDFLKLVVYYSYSLQCKVLEGNIYLFNEISRLFFKRYLESKLSITHFIFSQYC